jgi:ankyrin repeat protein
LGDVCAISKDSKDVNAWDTGDSTPLAWALNNEYLEFVWVLLKYGSNWKARDRRGKTPLHWASEKGLPGFVSSLSPVALM